MSIKQTAAGLLACILILSAGMTGAKAETTDPVNRVIYQTVDSKTITSGVTQNIVTRYTDLGWQKIYIMKADLNNPNVHIDALTNNDTIQKPLSTTDHMKEWGAIAGLNGSFFLASEQAGSQNLIGPMVQAYDLKTADPGFNLGNDSMATFSINLDNKANFDYWKTTISLHAQNNKTLSIGRYNEPYYGHTDFTIIDRKWRATTIGTRNGYYSDITEMIVVDGVVREIRQNQPATDIPLNGYVVITRKENASQIVENFKVGDTVKLDVNTSPNWGVMKMALTGGGMLVVDGYIPDTFTHEITGRHPRTAIGSSQNGKTLFMVVVDGRQSHSIGMTMKELAEFMVEIGAYDALVFDGGGSSTMASREPGTENIVVQNSPSDGVQRRIPNALGVFSLAPPSKLAGLYINTTNPDVFVNTSREFTVTGYDEYFNPVIINPEDIKWEVKGVQGSFDRNGLKPLSPGKGIVVAKIGDVTSEFPINVLKGPVKLSISHKDITLISKERKTFNVIGEDENGYKAPILPSDVIWKTVGGIGFFSTNTFVSTNSGYGCIRASVGDVSAYCAVTVLPTQSIIVDDFEKQNASYLPYPSTVSGSYTISKEQKHSGNSSGKLSYCFENADYNRAAYVELSGNGIVLPENAIRIGFWVYNSQENSNWLRIEVNDSSNRKYRLGDLTKLDWKGWRYVEIPLTGVPTPARLTRIYLVQVNPIEEIGAVYFDDLSIITVEREKMTKDTTVKGIENIVLHNFENNDISFFSYPSWVPGGVEVGDAYANSGTSSARLDYVFKEAPETQAAYLTFSGNGLNIPKGTESIGLWAYSKEHTRSWLRAEVMDAAGKKHYVMFSEGIQWTGWKFVSGSVAHIPQPARLTRVYVVNPSPINEEGHIYIDDLQLSMKIPDKIDFKNLPKDTKAVDSLNQAITYAKGENNYRFSIFGESREPATDVEKYLSGFLADKINKYIEIGAFIGNSQHNVTKQIQNPVVATGAGYDSMDMKNSRFIKLDMRAKTLKNGTGEQWHWLLEQLETFTGNNIFLFLDDNPDAFKDGLETELFRKILSDYSQTRYKNVWVFYKGQENIVTMDRGVRYLSSCGFDVDRLTADNKAAAKYMLVTIMGEQVTYEYKPIE
ncbi:MAG: phosphodiester glycosidase family protein [Ruminiclostridium sp.]|nr:phosphodiester glycosidase family protein [Ruminiclostridium sp.]